MISQFIVGQDQRCADPRISRLQIIRVRKHQVRGRSVSATVMATHVRGPSASASRVGLHCIQQTMSRAPHSQTGLHSLLQCPNMDQFSNCWELVHWHFRSRLVMQTILVVLDPQMVRVRKGVCLADPRPQENLRIRVRAYPRPQCTHLWSGCSNIKHIIWQNMQQPTSSTVHN